MIKMNTIPKNIFVFIMAKISSAPESLTVKIWVKIRVAAINIPKDSRLKNPALVDIIKNQNDAPAVTATLLNLGEDSSISDRINECD